MIETEATPRKLDYPFEEIVEAVNRHAANGTYCYQKFSCEKCNQRLTMEAPNTLYKTGNCDKCGHVTNIEAKGCNYMLHIPLQLKKAG